MNNPTRQSKRLEARRLKKEEGRVQSNKTKLGKEFEDKILQIGQLLKPNIKDVTKGEENAFDARPMLPQNIFFDQEFPEGELRWMIDAKHAIGQDVYKILSIAHAIDYNHENNFDNVKQVLVYGDIGPRTYRLITESFYGKNAYLIHESRYAEWLMTDPDKREQHIYVESDKGEELDNSIEDLLDDLEQGTFEEKVLQSYNEELQREYADKIFNYDGTPKVLCLGAYTGFGKSYMAKTHILKKCLEHNIKVYEFVAPQQEIVEDCWGRHGLSTDLSVRHSKRIEIVIPHREKKYKEKLDALIRDEEVDLVIVACTDSAWSYNGTGKKTLISRLIESYHEEGVLDINESFVFRDEGHYSGTSHRDHLKGNTGYANNKYDAAVFNGLDRRTKYTKYCVLASATLVREQISDDFGTDKYHMINEYPKKEQNMLGTSKLRKFHWMYENKPKGYLSGLRKNGTLEAGNNLIQSIIKKSYKIQKIRKEEYNDLIENIVDINGVTIAEESLSAKSWFGGPVMKGQIVEFLKKRFPFKQCTIVQCENDQSEEQEKKGKPNPYIGLKVVIENFKKAKLKGEIHYVIDTADKTELWDYNGGDPIKLQSDVESMKVYSKMNDPKDPLKWLFVKGKGKMGINIHTLDSVLSFCERGAKDDRGVNVTYMSEQYVGRAVRLRCTIEEFLYKPDVKWNRGDSTAKQLVIDFYNLLNSFDVHVPKDSKGNWTECQDRIKRKIGTTYDSAGYLNSKL